MDMKGSLLKRRLDQGLLNRGNEGYLQTSNVARSKEGWLVSGVTLDTDRTYCVALNDYLLSGRERGLSFLTRDNTQIRGIRDHGDIRRAFIEHLQKTRDRRSVVRQAEQ